MTDNADTGDGGDPGATGGDGSGPTARHGTLVDWREWGQDAFDRAEARTEPVLLYLTAPWCVACAEMDAETFAEPRLAAHVGEGFVPVRVDADRHPRVRERYNMGGFPSTVFATPAGEVMTGATYLGPGGFRGILDSVRELWASKGTDAGRIPRALRDPDPPAGEVTADVEAHMVQQVAASFDEEFGGWGQGGKFPLPRTVEFAAKRDRDRAMRTLEAVHTHLHDTYDGGFYRYTENRNWSGIHREKLLDENAALCRAFVTGYLYTGKDTYREAAESGTDYLTTTLWTGEAFAGSQAGGDYYTLEASDREEAEPPHIDATVFADRNGLAADALLRFHAVTGAEAPRRYAVRALDHVLETLAEDGTVTHYEAGEGTAPSGLLVDAARLLAGLTTAVQVTGEGRYLDAAREVADGVLDLQATDGAFLDGPAEGPGLLDRPLRPLDTNVELADALIDLAYLVDGTRYREAAGDALAAFAGAADRMGVEVAAYAAACARHHHDPLVVETPPAGTDLHRGALRIADHEKVVLPGDRETAVVRRGGKRSAPAADPEELSTRVGETDQPSLE
ncbi:thioredoxin domain-containing protein [Halobacteriales archaeon QS_5_70_15]|nr:MAG: thioredoxin domain-containing protein [Halobacteriales archaeon QS_5_70_15]